MKFTLFDQERDIIIVKGIAVVIFLVASLSVIYVNFWTILDMSLVEDWDDSATTAGSCNVMGINLHGEVITYVPLQNEGEGIYSTQDETASESIMQLIEMAEADEKIKAIVMEVDSPGGSPVGGEEISLALKNAKKPTAAFIRESGLSSAYFAAVGADKIFASKYSDIGSIGITMSYLDSSRENSDGGLTYNSLSSGKFKDSGDPDKELTEEEKKLFMRDVNIMKDNFVRAVAEGRKLDIKKVEALADGSSMLGEAALKNGLIDEIGGYAEAKAYIGKVIGEQPEICWN